MVGTDRAPQEGGRCCRSVHPCGEEPSGDHGGGTPGLKGPGGQDGRWQRQQVVAWHLCCLSEVTRGPGAA